MRSRNAGETMIIHHECLCGIGKFLPKGTEFQLGNVLPLVENSILSGEIIRTIHRCKVQIENSIQRVTVLHHDSFHHEALLRDRIFSLHRILMFDSFTCKPMFYFKVPFITMYKEIDIGHSEILLPSDISVT